MGLDDMYVITIRQQKIEVIIRVFPNQRICAALHTLRVNGHILGKVDKLLVFSKRRQEFLNQKMTFREAGIYDGDTLELQ